MPVPKQLLRDLSGIEPIQLVEPGWTEGMPPRKLNTDQLERFKVRIVNAMIRTIELYFNTIYEGNLQPEFLIEFYSLIYATFKFITAAKISLPSKRRFLEDMEKLVHTANISRIVEWGYDESTAYAAIVMKKILFETIDLV